ncbi:MAG: 16S rRNA (uracil(1498)-N(3))-methyltransferase [Oscillospiraceae bacterium]|nr:16S rRNA (uracil(1498)-N(3))-methyltransferase [Oscillospiraceae bacterium]
MARFFVAPDAISGKFAVLTGEAAAHVKVLRLKNGDGVTLCTGDGTELDGVISDLSPDAVSVVIRRADRCAAEPRVFVSVYMALPKSDKFEHVVQKATELGAGEIAAFPSARCVSRPDEKSLGKKLERWQKIAAAAAEQSGRGIIPKVLAIPSYDAALKRAAESDLAILLYENEQKLSLRQAVAGTPHRTAALMTGPEGGFEDAEIAQAQSAGLKICTLGPRILRCETAPLCALTALMFADGELEETQGDCEHG